MSCFAYTQDPSPYLPAASHLTHGIPMNIYGDMSDVDQVNLKVQLRNRLNHNQLSNMPGGFPFRHVFDGHGSAWLSMDSYEFREELTMSSHNQRARYQTATISYTSVSRKCNYYTWRAFLPSLDPSYCRGSTRKFAVAHVQVEPSLLKTQYGQQITRDPSIILRALSISLELGVQITIQVVNPSTPLPRSHKNGPWKPGSIVYIGRHNNGKEEILFGVGQ